MDIFKFNDGKVHFINSRWEGLNLHPSNTVWATTLLSRRFPLNCRGGGVMVLVHKKGL